MEIGSVRAGERGSVQKSDLPIYQPQKLRKDFLKTARKPLWRLYGDSRHNGFLRAVLS